MDPTVVSSTTDFSAHFTSAAAIVYFIEGLKKWERFKWLDDYSARANQIASLLFAVSAAVGINWTMAEPTGAAAGTYVITVTGLTWPAVGAAIWEFGKQFAAQQVIYDGVVARKPRPISDKAPTFTGTGSGVGYPKEAA